MQWLHHEAMAYLQELRATVQAGAGVVGQYGVWMVFGSLLIESAGVIFAPGETFLIASGFLAAQGTLNPGLLFLLAVAGTSLGWFLAYFLGERVGISWLRKHGRWIGVTPDRLQKAHRFLEKYGSIVVLFGRFVVPLRQLQGYISGSAEVPFRDFYLWNVLGAVTWVSFWGGAGYLLGLL